MKPTSCNLCNTPGVYEACFKHRVLHVARCCSGAPVTAQGSASAELGAMAKLASISRHGIPWQRARVFLMGPVGIRLWLKCWGACCGHGGAPAGEPSDQRAGDRKKGAGAGWAENGGGTQGCSTQENSVGLGVSCSHCRTANGGVRQEDTGFPLSLRTARLALGAPMKRSFWLFQQPRGQTVEPWAVPKAQVCTSPLPSSLLWDHESSGHRLGSGQAATCAPEFLPPVPQDGPIEGAMNGSMCAGGGPVGKPLPLPPSS